MEIAEYFDSLAAFWDDDFSEAKPARVVASTISIPRGGACVLDIGCGSGSMFMDLLESGACEIEGLDISGGMVGVAKEKFCFDPRIHVEKGDLCSNFLRLGVRTFHDPVCDKHHDRLGDGYDDRHGDADKGLAVL